MKNSRGQQNGAISFCTGKLKNEDNSNKYAPGVPESSGKRTRKRETPGIPVLLLENIRNKNKTYSSCRASLPDSQTCCSITLYSPESLRDHFHGVGNFYSILATLSEIKNNLLINSILHAWHDNCFH